METPQNPPQESQPELPMPLEKVLEEFVEQYPEHTAEAIEAREHLTRERQLAENSQQLRELLAKRERGEGEAGDSELIDEHRREIWRLQNEQQQNTIENDETDK